MITITFNGAVNSDNLDLYQEIFADRLNPNGCQIKGMCAHLRDKYQLHWQQVVKVSEQSLSRKHIDCNDFFRCTESVEGVIEEAHRFLLFFGSFVLSLSLFHCVLGRATL
jgi:hypothetical protein